MFGFLFANIVQTKRQDGEKEAGIFISVYFYAAKEKVI